MAAVVLVVLLLLLVVLATDQRPGTKIKAPNRHCSKEALLMVERESQEVEYLKEPRALGKSSA